MAKSENGAAVTYVHDAAGEVLEGHIAFGAGKTRTKATKAKTKAPPLCSTSQKVVKQARDQASATGDDPKLAAHAAMIRRLGKRVRENVIEIGRRLHEAKQLVGHGGWEAWLKKEFDWSQGTATNFMNLWELAEYYKSRNFQDLNIPLSALYLLAKSSTPEAVRTEVVARAEAGEPITVKAVKAATKATAANPTNDWAKDIRRGFGQVVAAANAAIAFGQQANAVISPELRQQMREALESVKRQLPVVERGGKALLAYFSFIENILADDNAESPPLSEAAE